MYSDRRGVGKNHPGKNLPDKRSPDKSPRKQFRENLYMGLLSGFFLLGLLKNGGGSRCVRYFWRVSGCVTTCDRGRGVKMDYGLYGPSQTVIHYVICVKIGDE